MWPISGGRFFKLLLLNDSHIIFNSILVHIIYCLTLSTDTITLLGSNHRGTLLNLLSLFLNYPTLSSCFFILIFLYFATLVTNFQNHLIHFLRVGAFLLTLNIHYVFYSKTPHESLTEITNFLLTNGLNEIHPPLLYISVVCVLINTLSLYTLNFLWTFYNKWQFTNSYIVKPAHSSKITLTALLLGSWWAFQESSWSGWWAWEISETLLLYLYVVTLIFFHIRFSVSMLNIVSVYLIFICVLYILKHVIILETVGTLHTFFSGSLFLLQDFPVCKLLLLLVTWLLVFMLIIGGSNRDNVLLTSTPWNRCWYYIILFVMIWTFLFSFYNSFSSFKIILLLFLVIIAASPLPLTRRAVFLVKNKSHLALILFFIAQLCYSNSSYSLVLYNTYCGDLNSFLCFDTYIVKIFNISNSITSSDLFLSNTFIFKLTLPTVSDFMHAINYTQRGVSLQSISNEDLFHSSLFYLVI